MKEKQRHADEMSSREFLYEYGYKIATEKNGYKAEFDRVKEVLPNISGFDNLPDFIRGVEADSILANMVVKDLIKFWQSDFGLRPDTGIILLLAIWKRLEEVFKSNKGFVIACENVFFVLAGMQPYEQFSIDEHTDVIATLLKEIEER